MIESPVQAPELLPADETFSALIFDCDGTLVDTAPAHLSAFNRALAGLNVAMTPEFLRPRFGLTPHALLSELSEDQGVPFAPDPVIATYSEVFQSDLSGLREIPLVANVARAQAGRVPLAVASNSIRANLEQTLGAVGLRELFDVVVAVDDVAQGKPAPDLYLEAARRLGVPPAECIVFEDTDEGLEASRRAGMRGGM